MTELFDRDEHANIVEDILMEVEPTNDELIAATRLTKDLKKASATLSGNHARYLVDLYYALQRMRIRAAAQVRSAAENEPNILLNWTADMYETLENDVKGALGIYAKSRVSGMWATSITGIGPVIAAGLLAHIDITRLRTAGALWRYSGYDPTVIWGKGQKRPWNARLKRLGWLAGQSFVKSSNRESSHYGPLYKQRKAYEMEKNEKGDYADQAKLALQTKNYGAETDARKWYEQGRLPPAHIQARAERWTVKIFLSHYFAVTFEDHYHEKPVQPYAIKILGHAHELVVPNWPLEPAK